MPLYHQHYSKSFPLACHVANLPKANRWDAVYPSGFAPSARYGHSAVWTAAGNGFYVFGGYLSSRNLSHFSRASLDKAIAQIHQLCSGGLSHALYFYNAQATFEFFAFACGSCEHIRRVS